MGAMEKCPFNVAENTKNCSVVSRSSDYHKLNDQVNCIGNVGLSDREVDKTVNQLAVKSGIQKGLPISDNQFHIDL